MKRHLLVLTFLVGCGTGSQPDTTVTVSNSNTQTQTTEQNQGSQNGEAECHFECEPAVIAGVAGSAVTEICSGVIQNGPNFFEHAPSGCVEVPPAEEVATEEAA